MSEMSIVTKLEQIALDVARTDSDNVLQWITKADAETMQEIEICTLRMVSKDDEDLDRIDKELFRAISSLMCLCIFKHHQKEELHENDLKEGIEIFCTMVQLEKLRRHNFLRFKDENKIGFKCSIIKSNEFNQTNIDLISDTARYWIEP